MCFYLKACCTSFIRDPDLYLIYFSGDCSYAHGASVNGNYCGERLETVLHGRYKVTVINTLAEAKGCHVDQKSRILQPSAHFQTL